MDKFTIIEIRQQGGKLTDLLFDGPEHAIENALRNYKDIVEINVVSNPRNYKLSCINEIKNTPIWNTKNV